MGIISHLDSSKTLVISKELRNLPFYFTKMDFSHTRNDKMVALGKVLEEWDYSNRSILNY